METRFVVNIKSLVIASLLLLGYSPLSNADASSSDSKAENSRQQIRFYKVNSKRQTSKILFANKKGKLTSCQNFYKKTRVYQANQFGFKQCVLYSKKNCSSDSTVQVNRKKEKSPTSILTQGYSWHPISDSPKGVKLKSWKCDS